jgi:hypothetical protein
MRRKTAHDPSSVRSVFGALKVVCLEAATVYGSGVARITTIASRFQVRYREIHLWPSRA